MLASNVSGTKGVRGTKREHFKNLQSPSLEVEDDVFLPFFVVAADVNDNDGATQGSENHSCAYAYSH